MQTGNKAAIRTELFKHFIAHMAHDAHIHDNVSGVRQLHADQCQWAIGRSHAKWDNVHGSARHASLELFSQLASHFIWSLPVVRSTSVYFPERTNERSVLHAGRIRRVAPSQERIWVGLSI